MNFKTILWVVGEPGVGKTTFVRAMLGDLWTLVTEGAAKWTIAHHGRVVAAGHYNCKPFDGGDTISYTGAKATCSYWWNSLYHGAELTILDGDRMSTDSVIEYFMGCREPRVYIRIVCCMLTAPPHVTKVRRDARGPQTESWVKGRKTKAERFFNKFGADSVLVSSNCDFEELKRMGQQLASQLLYVGRSMSARDVVK